MIKEVATHGNLTKAAEYLYLSQSALSHQLKEIESFFGTQVFIRQKKQMLLTNTGEVILQSAQKILEELETTQQKIKTLNDKESGVITISTECYTSYHWLSSFLSEFQEAYPKVDVNIVPEATYNSVQYLLNNKIDIAIVEDNSNPKLDYYPLFKDEFVALAAPTHTLAAKRYATCTDFSEENYIMYNIPNEQSTIYNILFTENKPKKVYKIALTEAIVQMVKANMGVTILPQWVVKPQIDSGELVAIPLTKKGIKRTWYAATLKNKFHPPYIAGFIKNLSRHLKQSEQMAMLSYS